jgi:hypothetical protein
MCAADVVRRTSIRTPNPALQTDGPLKLLTQRLEAFLDLVIELLAEHNSETELDVVLNEIVRCAQLGVPREDLRSPRCQEQPPCYLPCPELERTCFNTLIKLHNDGFDLPNGWASTLSFHFARVILLVELLLHLLDSLKALIELGHLPTIGDNLFVVPFEIFS